ncbi:hypothetical protein ABDZ24_28850 (plasmid) [Bacillus paramobilis]
MYNFFVLGCYKNFKLMGMWRYPITIKPTNKNPPKIKKRYSFYLIEKKPLHFRHGANILHSIGQANYGGEQIQDE